jgi:spiro-SPASM protein
LDKIRDFSGEAVLDLSLWGEIALHPQKIELIKMILSRREFFLIIETSGIGWKKEELEALATLVQQTHLDLGRSWGIAGSPAPTEPLSWIVSLDSADAERYGELRGQGFEEAVETAKALNALFPGAVYVQALRVQGSEDDTEQFYRYWKEAGVPVIIQKYDDFAGVLPKKQASDLSPLKRRPCWHLIRDMNILIDGRVPQCREDLAALAGNSGGNILGNAFDESLESIWSRGEPLYREHCVREAQADGNAQTGYPGICAECDEYYTFNF